MKQRLYYFFILILIHVSNRLFVLLLQSKLVAEANADTDVDQLSIVTTTLLDVVSTYIFIRQSIIYLYK